jgi:hypothetical protein
MSDKRRNQYQAEGTGNRLEPKGNAVGTGSDDFPVMGKQHCRRKGQT